jgi:hypothetical protein
MLISDPLNDGSPPPGETALTLNRFNFLIARMPSSTIYTGVAFMVQTFSMLSLLILFDLGSAAGLWVISNRADFLKRRENQNAEFIQVGS